MVFLTLSVALCSSVFSHCYLLSYPVVLCQFCDYFYGVSIFLKFRRMVLILFSCYFLSVSSVSDLNALVVVFVFVFVEERGMARDDRRIDSSQRIAKRGELLFFFKKNYINILSLLLLVFFFFFIIYRYFTNKISYFRIKIQILFIFYLGHELVCLFPNIPLMCACNTLVFLSFLFFFILF